MVVALSDYVGEEAKLSDGTTDFAVEASMGKTSLRHSPADDLLALAIDPLGNGFKEGRPFIRISYTVFAESVGRSLSGPLDLRRIELAVFGIE